MILAALVLATTAGLPPPKAEGCRVIPADQVVTVQGARVVLGPKPEIFPEVAVQRSGDDQFWGCWRGGVLRDLYAPPLPSDYSTSDDAMSSGDGREE